MSDMISTQGVPSEPPQTSSGSEAPGGGGTIGAAGEQASAAAGEVAATAAAGARTVLDDTRGEARRLAEESRGRLRAQAAEQTDRLAAGLQDVSQQLSTMLRGDGPAPQGVVADVTRQVADRAANLAGELQAKSPEQLLDELRRFARRKPAIFLASAAAAGFVSGRLIRAVNTHDVIEAAKTGAQSDGEGDRAADNGARGTTSPIGLPERGAAAPTSLEGSAS